MTKTVTYHNAEGEFAGIDSEFEMLRLDSSLDDSYLPNGGFHNEDDHLLVFVANYFEDEIADSFDEDNPDFDSMLFPHEGVESTLDEEDSESDFLWRMFQIDTGLLT